MGPIWWWLLGAVGFGLLSGALYTWMSPRRGGGWVRLFIRSSLAYTLLGLAIVWVLFMLS